MYLLVLSSYRMIAVFPGETGMEMIFTIRYVYEMSNKNDGTETRIWLKYWRP